MKTTYTLVILLILTHILKAQPALNSQIVPSFGTTVSAQSKTDNTLDPGSAGASQVWDFSAVTFSAAAATSTIVNPSTTAYGSSFPSATIAEHSASGNYLYYDLTSTHQTVLGTRDNANGVTVVYSDAMNVINYPFAYNTSQSDTYSASYIANGYTITVNGTVTTEYDGYGTLSTVNGTYNNVVRLKSTKNEDQDVDYGGFMLTTNFNSVTYSYALPGNLTPLFAIIEMDITYFGSTSSSKSAILYDVAAISGNKTDMLQNLKISVSPNPASEKISVDFKDLPSDNYELTLSDEKGMVVLQDNFYATKGDVYDLIIGALTSGTYFMKVSSSNGEAIKKIIKI